jgi:hypothetical protein
MVQIATGSGFDSKAVMTIRRHDKADVEKEAADLHGFESLLGSKALQGRRSGFMRFEAN